MHAQLDDDDWLIGVAKVKNGLKSGVNSGLKSDPIIDIDFSTYQSFSHAIPPSKKERFQFLSPKLNRNLKQESVSGLLSSDLYVQYSRTILILSFTVKTNLDLKSPSSLFDFNQRLLHTWTDSLGTLFKTFAIMRISKNDSNI